MSTGAVPVVALRLVIEIVSRWWASTGSRPVNTIPVVVVPSSRVGAKIALLPPAEQMELGLQRDDVGDRAAVGKNWIHRPPDVIGEPVDVEQPAELALVVGEARRSRPRRRSVCGSVLNGCV